jgi:hypothetical protein
MNHYEQTLINLEQINYGSSGYSEMNLQVILMILGIITIHILGYAIVYKGANKYD